MERLPLLLSIFLAIFAHFSLGQLLINARNAHFASEVSSEQAEYLAKLSNITHIQEVLDNLLVPRVVGTPTHERVHQYITKELTDLGWNIEVDEFKATTPVFGSLTFKNIVATLNPDADRFLALACHYDSKYFKDNPDFVGATDSAVPCAMMLNLAKTMKKELDEIKGKTDLSLKLIFFDGEEAFQHWGPQDSIYGAKHLARKWERELRATTDGESVNDLSRIDVLVLLDLIGAANPDFYCFFPDTQKWYNILLKAEEGLAKLGLLENYVKNHRIQKYFHNRLSYSYVEDDHIPFLKRGVPVLHLIPTPFPKEWHTPEDNRNAIDMPTVENLNKIMRNFVAEYLHLLPSDGTISGRKHQEEL